jgi:hypothetical protein
MKIWFEQSETWAATISATDGSTRAISSITTT